MIKLSICLVTMNRAEQLANAINSCLLCELPKETEFIIVDNASKDDTMQTVELLSSKIDYPVKYVKLDKNIGAGAGRNKYCELASGEYIYGMDDDAIIDYDNCPYFFTRALQILDNNDEIISLATQIYDEAWKKNRLEISGKEFIDGVYYCKMFCEGSHFLRKKFFSSVPYLPNKYGYEGLVPSLKIWDARKVNAFVPELLAIHQPKIDKWDYSKTQNYGLLINECSVPYAIKRMMYPRIFAPVLLLALKIRCRKYTSEIPDGALKIKNAVRDMYKRYPINYTISIKTIFRLLAKFGMSVF